MFVIFIMYLYVKVKIDMGPHHNNI